MTMHFIHRCIECSAVLEQCRCPSSAKLEIKMACPGGASCQRPRQEKLNKMQPTEVPIEVYEARINAMQPSPPLPEGAAHPLAVELLRVADYLDREVWAPPCDDARYCRDAAEALTRQQGEIARLTQAYRDSQEVSMAETLRGNKAEDALAEAEARAAALQAKLLKAAVWFREYADMHTAKHTPDADAKAQTNLDRAVELEACAALNATRKYGLKPVDHQGSETK